MDASDLIKKVRKIEIKTKALSHQIFAGEYHSAFKGRGMAFSEVREYQWGDDVRSMDWNVTARLRSPYVKVFEEERELTVVLLVDVSRSGLFGTAGMTKRERIAEIAAVLSFSAILNNDKVGALFFSDHVEKFIPPAKGRSHLLHIIREMLELQPTSDGTDIGGALRYLTNAIKKKCTAFILPWDPLRTRSMSLPTARRATKRRSRWRQAGTTSRSSKYTTRGNRAWCLQAWCTSRTQKRAVPPGSTRTRQKCERHIRNGSGPSRRRKRNSSTSIR